MDQPPNDGNSSNLFSLIKKRPANTNQDLPALPEGRVFEPEQNADASMITDSDRFHQSLDPSMKKKKHCLNVLRPPRWLRHSLNWLYRKTGGVVTYLAFFILIYVLLWIFTDKEALPPSCYDYTGLIESDKPDGKVALCFGGKTLSITLFYAFAFAVGEAIEFIRIPGLAGMLISGLILRMISVLISPYEIIVDGIPSKNGTTPNSTTPLLPFQQQTPNSIDSSRLISNPIVTFAATMRVSKGLSSSLRQIALATILTRAGLGLKPSTLRRTWSGVLRLTCIPCLTEAFVCTIVAKYLMSWPWSWAFMMGFVLAAVSPAVVVPNMLRLEIAGWGMAAGIPTLVMAAASLDDVLAITGFGVAQAIAFSEGQVVQVAFKGPTGVAIGALSGMLLAIVICILPPPGMEHSNSLRGMLLYGISVASITGTLKIDLPGAGALCCLVCALSCSYGWQHGLPWRFKHSNPEAVVFTRESHNVEHNYSNKDIEEFDTESSGQKRKQDLEESEERSQFGPETMHHEYYRQHLRMLRKLLKKSGGVAGSKNALATVSRGSRRFSLPEPKPDYEEEEFDQMMDKKRRTKLTRSLSASRPPHSKSSRNRTTSDSFQADLNVDVVNDDSSNVDKVYETTSVIATNSSLAKGSKKRGKTTSGELTEAEKAELLELAKAKGNECLKVMRNFVSTCWWFVQPLLFCLIGADIPFEKLKGPVILKGIASILIALFFRLIGSFLAVLPSKMNMKERLFVAIAWIPKATVQAAIGPLALDSARKFGDPDQIRWGEEIITLAALSIVITAPAAAFLIPIVAPYLLRQSDADHPSPRINQDTRNHNNPVSEIQTHDADDSDKKKPKIEQNYEVVRQGPEPENAIISATQETVL
nr:hypothetical transcript [Hymenolepis microstoma]